MTTTTAPFRSILFDGRPEGEEGTDPSIFADLNLDQVFAAVTAGRDEYDLMPFFSTPLQDLQTVEYRHQILRDMETERSGEGWRSSRTACATCASTSSSPPSSATGIRKESWFPDAARMPTSYGEDLYQAVLGVADQQARV